MENNRTILRTQQRFRSEAHNVFTEKLSKTALSTNHDNRIQTPSKVILCPYGTSHTRVCKQDLMKYRKIKNKYND